MTDQEAPEDVIMSVDTEDNVTNPSSAGDDLPPPPPVSLEPPQVAVSSSNLQDDAEPLLWKGDLIRVSESGLESSKRLNERDGHLGRITKCTQSSDSEKDGEETLYDVEWILGGKLSGLRRSDMVHTTVENEGMTEDASRNRRNKRKPTSFMDEVVKQDAVKSTKKKAVAAKKKAETVKKVVVVKKKAAAVKKSKPKASSAKPKSQAQNGKQPSKPKRKTADSKPKAGKKRRLDEIPPPEQPVVSAALDVYERHRREFERILARLEKVDPFGFFFDDVPLEYDENYDIDDGGDCGDDVDKEKEKEKDTPSMGVAEREIPLSESVPCVDNDAKRVLSDMVVEEESKSQPSPLAKETAAVDDAQREIPLPLSESAPCVDKDAKGESSDMAVEEGEKSQSSLLAKETAVVEPATEPTDETKPPITYPSHPPFNWEMVRRRCGNGRYVADRIKYEEEERQHLLGPYYKSLGKRACNKILGRKKNGKSKPRVLHTKGVDWNLFRDDVLGMCEAAVARDSDESTGACGSLTHAANKLKETLLNSFEKTGKRQMLELSFADDRHNFTSALQNSNNTSAAMQGSWRRQAFPERKYEQLSSDVVCAGLPEVDERIALHELKTNLPDSFIGLSYKYDDTGESEAWMKSVIDEAGSRSTGESTSKDKSQNNEERQAAQALAADEGVVRAQVVATMQSLLIGVQDKVMTDLGTLQQSELRSANWLTSSNPTMPTSETLGSNGGGMEGPVGDSKPADLAKPPPELVEQPVWGIDCYTRNNILACLETDFDHETALLFIEKWLLPAINACPVSLAHDILNATRLLEGLPFQAPGADEVQQDTTTAEAASSEDYSSTLMGRTLREKIISSAPSWLKAASNQLRRARGALGADFFRVHPKGHGSVLLCSKVKASRLVTFYRGEVYPSWRWGEKMDAIDITQRRKEVKPALPDFYNMALERPQTDPRGYGLLFVDASRKSGLGSSLSHSCAPTCEVRVAAVNGELCLVMTTLRELEMGEELTFDYNAVTESLNEYQSAVCLCGYGKCRGSFLHFATADCYQQVLNRNSPIAARFANLVKGSMKQVMSDDDEKVLKNHGFLTAAFGAISVNRHMVTSTGHGQALLDSLENVPVWLRTFVADVLRYIEYERRALPISLICDHLSSAKKQSDRATSPRVLKEPTKPENTFFFFSRTETDFVQTLLKQQGFPEDASGIHLRQAMQKVASTYWNALDEEAKQPWKEKALVDFERKKKDWRAAQRKASKESKGLPKTSSNTNTQTEKTPKRKPKAGSKAALSASAVSFEDADAEGVSAMEQRIQQLTQALSRVGRVLDRHQEACFDSKTVEEAETAPLRSVHSPLTVLPDDEVISWLWTKKDGVVAELVRSIENAKCTRPSLLPKLLEAKANYTCLDTFGSDRESSMSIDSERGRHLLSEALLKFRVILLEELEDMSKEYRQYRSRIRQDAVRESGANDVAEEAAGEVEEPVVTEEATLVIRPVNEAVLEGDQENTQPGLALSFDSITRAEPIVSSVANNVIEEVVRKNNIDVERDEEYIEAVRKGNIDVEGNEEEIVTVGKGSIDVDGNEEVISAVSTGSKTRNDSESDASEANLSLWLEYYGQRYMLQAAADLLLLYARTSNFFVLKPYQTLTSSPVEVYARELGNAVPRSAIDRASDGDAVVSVDTERSLNEVDQLEDESDSQRPETTERSCSSEKKSSQKRTPKSAELCMPDDIVAEVSIKYDGDFVLSQLLQWYNGGIGQAPGLPDMLGCAVLPSMEGCWPSGVKIKAKPERKTSYESKARPRLIEWLQDPHQRGDAWPTEVKNAFTAKDSNSLDEGGSSSISRPFGSPVTDFLVTGDETNLSAVLEDLDADVKAASQSSSGGLRSSVDRGRPAQAVSTWVQCENAECMKWRKIPWHVDVDLFPEKFFCKDNKWNQAANSCEIPEDDWDEGDALVGADGKVEGSPVGKKSKAVDTSPLAESSFRIGAQFDVLRKGKSNYTTGKVTRVDFSGKVKRIKFHFVKTIAKHDEWIEFRSVRIAALYSKTPAPKQTADKKRLIFDVGRDETVQHPTSQLKAAKEAGPQNGTKKGKKITRLNKTKDIESSKPDSVAQDEAAKNPLSRGKGAKELGAKKEKKKARLKETEGIMSSNSDGVAQDESKSDGAAHDETAKDPHSPGKSAKEPGTKKGKKKARLNEANGISSSKPDSVARSESKSESIAPDETAKDPLFQEKAAKEVGAKKGKRKAQLNEQNGIMSSRFNSAAQDETVKHPTSQVKAVKGAGLKNGKKKARLNEATGNMSSKPDSVAQDRTTNDSLSRGRAAKELGAKKGKKKAQLNEVVLSENDAVPHSSLNHGLYTRIPKKKRVSNVQTATGARFGVESVKEKEEDRRLKNAYESHGRKANHYHSSTTAGDSPQFAVAMPAESYRSGTMTGSVAERSGINSGINLGTNSTSLYQHPRGQRLSPSSSSATRPHDFTTDAAPMSSPFDQLVRLASVANVSTSIASHFDSTFGQHTPQPSNGPPPFDQLLRLASAANVPPSNGSHFDQPFSQNIPQPIQPNYHDSRSRMQPANPPPATSAPQDPPFQRSSDGAVDFDQHRFQDKQTHDQYPPRYYR